MSTLSEILLTEEKRPMVMSDARRLLDAEVKRKSGVSGFAVKAGYKMVKTFRSGFLDRVIEDLIPEFCDALEPLHKEHLEKDDGKTFGQVMNQRQSDVAAALLGVTDGKAQQSSNRVVKKTYLKLRPAAERNVRDAIPGLAELMDKHYGT